MKLPNSVIGNLSTQSKAVSRGQLRAHPPRPFGRYLSSMGLCKRLVLTSQRCYAMPRPLGRRYSRLTKHLVVLSYLLQPAVYINFRLLCSSLPFLWCDSSNDAVRSYHYRCNVTL